MDRRNFMRVTGGIAIGSVVASTPFTGLNALSPSVHIVVFHEPSFPCVQGIGCDRGLLEKALNGFDVSFAGLQSLESELERIPSGILVMPYGSAFPKIAWPGIERFLNAGGSLVNLGGVPFSVPVMKNREQWTVEVKQTAFHKKLGITQSFTVSAASLATFSPADPFMDSKKLVDDLSVDGIYELYVRFADTVDVPSESGSAGTKDAVLRPLVVGMSADGTRLAAPVVMVDRLIGDFAGGKWILASFSGAITVDGIRRLVSLAAEGAADIVTRPSYACYKEGELPSFTVRFRRPKSRSTVDDELKCTIEVRSSGGKNIDLVRTRLHGDAQVASATVAMRHGRAGSLAPGLYRVVTTLSYLPGPDDEEHRIVHETGFWVYDGKLMEGGKPFTADRFYLLRDGKSFPVTGTTYMGSDVHRKFLFEPNAWLWDRDFTEMKAAGINMVRTGIWTAWRSYMLDPGVPNETILRAMDAFVLTARKHDIPVIFTFFAFLPELWGGENAYLDPRSLAAQKEFVTSFVARYASAGDLIWDLINEPSFCSPQNLWSCRPNYDRFESVAWLSWLRKRYPVGDDEALRLHLQQLYRCTGREALALPAMEDFAGVNISGDRRPLKVVDYRLFAQEMFIEWTKEISSTIRRHGNPQQLITVGQDEAGTNDSPNPQFHAEAVDFTCLHNWWLNDDLVWDSIVTKSPLKPNLVEETGIMFYEKTDGSPWWSEEHAANLLERKLAISIATGGAGFIEWIWNANPYMKSDNEAAIGLHRADGTVKREYYTLVQMCDFMAGIAKEMTQRVEEPVLLVLPHSGMFSPRNFAAEATKRAVRTMCYENHVGMRSVSEYRLDRIGDMPKLMIVPSPGVLSKSAWEHLLEYAGKGVTVLITGNFEEDEHQLPVNRLRQFGIINYPEPVAQEEVLQVDGAKFHLSFRGEKMQRIQKGIIESQKVAQVVRMAVGSGAVIWSPLPVELADQPEVTSALYRYALKEANVRPLFVPESEDVPVLIYASVFAKAILYVLVSESSSSVRVKFTDAESGKSFNVEVVAQRSTMLLIRRNDGSILAPRFR